MSVLQCDRRGCENIMCDRHSNEYGYICDECFRELCGLIGRWSIYEFMRSDKPVDGNAMVFYYDAVFPIRTEKREAADA